METQPGDYLLVLTTWPEREAALAAAGQWVETGLAACVNLLPVMTSVYQWQGRIERGEEHQLLIKTSRSALPRLQTAILDAHPFEVPELLVLPIETGSPDYLRWIDTCIE